MPSTIPFPSETTVQATVYERAEGRCEAWCGAPGQEYFVRRPGFRKYPDNLILMCSHHIRYYRSPRNTFEAASEGFVVHKTSLPGDVEMHHSKHNWVYLRVDGGFIWLAGEALFDLGAEA